MFALCVPFNFKGSTVTTTWLSEETTSRHEGQLWIGLHYGTILTVLPTCPPDGTVHFHWLYQDHTNIRNNSVRQETFFPVFINLGFVKTSKAVVRSKVTIKFVYFFNLQFSFYFLIILFLNTPEFRCIWEGLQTLPSGLTFTHKITQFYWIFRIILQNFISLLFSFLIVSQLNCLFGECPRFAFHLISDSAS